MGLANFKSELNPHGNEPFVLAKTMSKVFPIKGHEMWLGQFIMPRQSRDGCQRALGLLEAGVTAGHVEMHCSLAE